MAPTEGIFEHVTLVCVISPKQLSSRRSFILHSLQVTETVFAGN
jgi:hypothetical protein